MNIILFTSVFYNNIGNGFIDLGAEVALNLARPSGSNVIKLSQCANFAASMDWKFRLREFPGIRFIWDNLMKSFAKQLHDKAYKSIKTENVISMALFAKCDYFVIPGCVLTVPFFKIFGGLLKEKIQQGAKLIFLGVSGNHYTDYEINFVKKWMEILKPHGIIFRDSVAYTAYNIYSKNTFNGIDNVFFVNRLDIPKFETTLDPYYVLNFDLKENLPILKNLENNELKGKNIIYTNHKPHPQSVITKEVKKGRIISDYPLDYLAVYRNVNTTYSDRVHACIPTLAFGNKAQLFSKSPRKLLFENVGLSMISTKPTRIEGLEGLQEAQINYLRHLLSV